MSLDSDLDRIYQQGDPSPALGTDSRPSLVSSFSLGKNEKREPELTLMSIADLLAEPVESTAWLVDGLLPQGGLSVLAGKPKAGKSTLARYLALAIARGDTVIGRNTTTGPVIYLGHEDKRSEIAEQFRAMGASAESLYIHTGPAPPTRKAVEQLATLISEHGAKLAIIDTLLRFVRVRDVSDYAEMTNALDPVLHLCRASGCHIMAVYHAPKSEREGLDAILGSVAIGGICDTGMILQRKADGRRTLTAIQRYGADLPETVLELDPVSRCVTAGATVAEHEQRQIECAILLAAKDEARTEPEIREAVGGDRGRVGRVLRELHKDGSVARTGKGVARDPFKYQAATTKKEIDKIY